MKADDLRHGTSAGYVAGCRGRCCKDAIADWMRHYRTRLYLCRSDELLVDGTGTRRRIRALMALGWSGVQLDEAIGRKRTYTANLILREGPIRRSTADAYAKVYLSLHDQEPPIVTRYDRQRSTRLRNEAERKGWPTPDRWFDIDDPAEKPDPGYAVRSDHARSMSDDFDPVVVDRIIGGDRTLTRAASQPERAAVVARWEGSYNDLERLTGWNLERYKNEVAESA